MRHQVSPSSLHSTLVNAPLLQVRMLGVPEVRLGSGALASFGSRKEQALFFYLALRSVPASRDTLADLLWPEKPEASAKNNLRTTLASLKRTFSPYLLSTPSTVAFNHKSASELDVKAIQEQLLTATHNRDSVAMHQAQKLYVGEFLHGFHVRRAQPFEAWLVEQREQLRLFVLRSLKLGTELCIERNDLERGLEMGQRQLSLEPWSEEAHRQVMQLLASSGQRAEALRQYELCRQQLSLELSAEPSDETTALYNRIRAGQITTSRGSRSAQGINGPDVAVPEKEDRKQHEPTVPHNLPALLTTVIGRQNETEQIAQSLGRPTCRLMSIVGLGGVGKSTLAIHAGRFMLQARPINYPDGIYFISLAAIAASDEGTSKNPALLRLVAQTIGCNIIAGMSLEKQLERFLKERHLLLILDNFEHLIGYTATLVALLERSPSVKVLTTSRVRLNVRGEAVLQLGTLSVPALLHNISHDNSHNAAANSSGEANILEKGQLETQWMESDAVTMFVQTAQLYNPHFRFTTDNGDMIYRICQLIDGLPLGVELACSMLPMLSLTELEEGIAETLDFLETEIRDIPEGQRTLRAVFEHSWRLLDSTEKDGLAALSLFPDTFNLQAAEQIAHISKSTLRRLLNQSLVEKRNDDRFGLHRSIREYGAEKLRQQESLHTTTRRAFTEHYLNFLAQQEQGQIAAEAKKSTAKLQVELQNIRLAWRQAVDDSLYDVLNLSMQTLFLYYEQQGLYGAGVEDAKYALQNIHLHEPNPTEHKTATQETAVPQKGPMEREQEELLLGRLNTSLAWMYIRLGYQPQAEQAIQAAYGFLQGKSEPGLMILCLSIWINIVRGSSPKKSKELCQEAKQLLAEVDTPSTQALVYQRAADIDYLLGNYEDAKAECKKAIALAEKADWKWGAAISHQTMGSIYRSLGRYTDARQHYQAGMAIAQLHNFLTVHMSAILSLGAIARLEGEVGEAKERYQQYKKMSKEMQLDYHDSAILWEEGCLAEQRGDYARAKTLFTQSLEMPRHHGQWGHVLPTLGWALIGLGEHDNAHDYFRSVLNEMESKHLLPVCLDAQAGLALTQQLRAHGAVDAGSAGASDPISATLNQIYDHPATTQQTRDRIAQPLKQG